MDMYRDPNATLLLESWRNFVASKDELKSFNGPWLYDLTDLTRQILSNFFVDVHGLFVAAYQRKDLKNAQSVGASLLEIITYLDDVLGTNVNFLLGIWLEDAKSWAKTQEESKAYEFNARNQVTLWGPTGQITDYASKAWAGLYHDYYYKRWSFFIDNVYSSISSGNPFNQNTYDQQILLLEQSWGHETVSYPTQPSNNTLTVALAILAKFATSNSNYTVLVNTDAPGNDIYHAWLTDVQQLKILCDLDTTCLGFNSNGFLKTKVSGSLSSPKCNLYAKQR